MRRHDLIGAKKTKGTIYMDEAQFHKRETADGGIISNRPLNGKVKSIKGNTVSWNQIVSTSFYEEISDVIYDGAKITIPQGSSGAKQIIDRRSYQERKIIGHKYLLTGSKEPSSECYLRDPENNINLSNTGSVIYVATKTEHRLNIICANKGTTKDYVFYPQTFDLTLIYGAGLEPSTPEQFEADYKKWFGKDLTYEPYDAGSLRSVTMEGFKSVGFNLLNLGGRTTPVNDYSTPTTTKQFDESQYWPLFAYNGYSQNISSRVVTIDNNYVYCSPGDSSYGVGFPIKCTPNTRYYTKSQHGAIGFFDSDGLHLNKLFTSLNGSFVTPDDCEWMVVVLCRVSGDNITEVNPIVNLDSSINGTYITGINPSDVSYDVTAMQGRLNGEGELVTPFAEGLKSAGTVHDEIVNDNGVLKGIKRIGSVDLGTKQFHKGGFGTYAFYLSSNALGMKKARGSIPCQLLCAKYPRSNYNDNHTCNIGQGVNMAALIIWDSSYAEADATTFQAAMSGVMLNYELETPEEYIMEASPLEYRCTRGGSEEVVGSKVNPTLEIEYEH